MSFRLSVATAGPAPAPLALNARDVVIGRGAEADWVIADPRVSGRHLLVGFRDGAYLLRDTSSNGTRVNGRSLAGIHRLAPGDVIRIGDTDILFDEAANAALPRGGVPAGDAAAPADALASALAKLLATRARQLDELGAGPDALAGHPLADPLTAAARLAALPPPAALAAVATAVDAVERHHAASLAAMRATLRELIAELDPAGLARAPGLPAAGPARDAALWGRYRALFEGDGLADAGFARRFADAFRCHHRRLAGA